MDVSAVSAVRRKSTGVALIGVDAAGQNSIIVASGANAAFPAADVEGIRAGVFATRAMRCFSWKPRSIPWTLR